MSIPTNSRELVSAALAIRDPYAAAAVYETATPAQRRRLQELMFAERRQALLFARWEHTPAAVLQLLAVTRDEAVKVRLDRNPGTPSKALANLYSEEKRGALVGLIVQHRHAPARLLEAIAADETDPAILKAVSSNPAAGGHALRTLVMRMPGTFDAELAANVSTPPDVLEQIYGRSNVYIRTAVVAHAACPRSVVQLAARESEVSVLRYLARDSRLDLQILARLAFHADAAVRRGAAGNRTLSAALVEHLVEDESAAVRRVIAAREDLPLNGMIRLASDADSWVRRWLGRNPSIPHSLLLQLAQDAEAEVRRAVARNPACRPSLLEQLAGDAEAWVRAGVAYQPNATAEQLRRLADDDSVDVQSGVASHRRTPQPVLRRLVQSAEADVRRGVILNPSARRGTLLLLLEDPYYLHRLLLVRSVALTPEDKWGLCDDPDQSVRFEVFNWFAEFLRHGTRRRSDEVVYGVIKEKDREDIGCSEAGCSAR